MFVDKIKVQVTAGDGGRGCVSFLREKFVAFGGPNGGDGGRGGNVIFEATENEQNLNALRYKSHFEAKRGQHGMGKQCHGKAGADVVVKVPIGTIVRDFEDDMKVVVDLDEHGATFVAAKGGAGGKGNMHFATSTNRAPRKITDPTLGDYREFELELKIIADIGLVGYPNAGKSTLISAVSNAHPETAPYPFTTLHPNVGIIENDDFTRMTMADIPGLIEGAHANVGLGHDFLRHIERTKVLLCVLDVAGVDGRTPWDDFEHLKKELNLYQDGLGDRMRMIAANKMDEDASMENLAELKQRIDLPTFPICAVLEDGCDDLLKALKTEVENARREEDEADETDAPSE